MAAPLTLDLWAAHIRQSANITTTDRAQGDQIEASLNDLAARLGITLTADGLRAAGFVLLATQALQQRHHGSQPGDPAFEKETVDILGWLQWIIAHRLDGDAGPASATGPAAVVTDVADRLMDITDTMVSTTTDPAHDADEIAAQVDRLRQSVEAGPEPLTMVDHKGRRCRMELVGNDWLYRAHPIKEGD